MRRRKHTKEDLERMRRYRRPRTIYALACPTCGTIRYVGQTVCRTSERLRKHLSKPLNEDVAAWFRELAQGQLQPVVIELAIASGTNAAAKAEQDWIALCSIVYGPSLLNRQHRGDKISITRFMHLDKRRIGDERYRRWLEDKPAREKRLREYYEKRKQQVLNSTYLVNGERLNASGWAKKLGISRQRMDQRLKKCKANGVSVNEALTTPAGETMPSFAGVKPWSKSRAS